MVLNPSGVPTTSASRASEHLRATVNTHVPGTVKPNRTGSGSQHSNAAHQPTRGPHKHFTAYTRSAVFSYVTVSTFTRIRCDSFGGFLIAYGRPSGATGFYRHRQCRCQQAAGRWVPQAQVPGLMSSDGVEHPATSKSNRNKKGERRSGGYV